jgi:hypothetical protein
VEEMTSTDMVTALIALYGAGLSTIIAVREWRARNPNIKVEVSEGSFGLAVGAWSGHMIFCDALNRGQKAITLQMVGFQLPNGEQFVIPYPSPYVRFPYDLLPEKSCKVFTSASDLAMHLRLEGWPQRVSLVGFYNDDVGRRYRSKPTVFDTKAAKLAR